MENYREYKSPITQWVDRKLTTLIERRAEEYARRYSTGPDGDVDENLANLIRYEVRRRGHMSKELDVYEPTRWVGVSFTLSLMLGSGLHYLMGEKNIRKLMVTGATSGAIGGIVSLVRPYIRFDAALYGGAQTALGMYDHPYGGSTPGAVLSESRADPAADRKQWAEREESRKNQDKELSR